MRRSYALFIFAAGALSAPAVHANPIDVYSPEWAVKGAATGFVNTGNVDRVLLRGDIAASYHNPNWAVSSASSYTWGTFGGIRTEDDLSNRNFVYAWPAARLYPFAMHWLETGLRRKITMRNQAGAGATWAIVSAPQTILKLSLMLSAEATDYTSPAFLPDGAVQTTERPLPRGTPRLYFRQGLAGEALSLISELWYQQALQSQNDYRWHWETGFEWALGKTLSFKTLLIYHYESAVPQRVVRQDVLLTVGVSARWSAATPSNNDPKGDKK